MQRSTSTVMAAQLRREAVGGVDARNVSEHALQGLVLVDEFDRPAPRGNRVERLRQRDPEQGADRIPRPSREAHGFQLVDQARNLR
jgi:hypothetical protein